MFLKSSVGDPWHFGADPGVKILFCQHFFSRLNTFMIKGKDPEPDPHVCGPPGSGTPTLLISLFLIHFPSYLRHFCKLLFWISRKIYCGSPQFFFLRKYKSKHCFFVTTLGTATAGRTGGGAALPGRCTHAPDYRSSWGTLQRLPGTQSRSP